MYLELFREISSNVERGRAKIVKMLVAQALAEGCCPQDILEYGLLSAMESISVDFRNYRIFVPEVIVASRAVNAGMELIEPLLAKTPPHIIGRAIIGTIEGDYHDIGKNLVGTMLKGRGIEVTDLGVDVPPALFCDSAEKNGADIICVSSSITTTMTNIPAVIKLLNRRGIRERFIVLVGGAPLNPEYAKKIGADGYAENAAVCADMVSDMLKKRTGDSC